MPEYHLDAHLDINFGLFSFIFFVVVMVGLYHLDVSFSAKVALVIGGIVLVKILSRRGQPDGHGGN